MKKALLESKYWFYIPIISLLFLPNIAEWAVEKESNHRSIIMLMSMLIHAISIAEIIEHL